ncbi:unnamed protein product [Rotaria socialis]
MVNIIEEAYAATQFDDIDKVEVPALMKGRLYGKLLKAMCISLPSSFTCEDPVHLTGINDDQALNNATSSHSIARDLVYNYYFGLFFNVHELYNSCGVQFDDVNIISLVDHSEHVERAVDEIETTDTDQSTRRSSRRRIPNRKYDNDYISPIINRRGLSNALSLKRCLSSSSDSISVSLKQNPIRDQHKKVKQLAPSTSDKEQNVFNKPPRVPKPQCIAELGTLTLKWPKYGINNGIYDGQSFSVTRICPIDTGLFALYHAYKAGSDKFQNLFENDNLDALVVLRDTFKYVETNDWAVVRLHWLVRHQLLNEKISDGRYDLKNTLKKIVFDYVRPMQIFEIISECSCIACPQRICKNSSVDLTLR